MDGYLTINYYEHRSYCDEPCMLEDYDLRKLTTGTTEIWYWYAIAPYEGEGELIARTRGGWEYWNLAHCSCNGPTDYGRDNCFPTLKELLASFTEEAKANLGPILPPLQAMVDEGKEQ